MKLGEKMIAVLTMIIVCMMFAVGFSSQAVEAEADMASADAVEESENELVNPNYTIENAKLAYEEQKKMEETRRREEEAAKKKAAEVAAAKKAAEEAAAKKAAAEEAARVAAEEAARIAQEQAAAAAAQQSQAVSAGADEQNLLAAIIFCEAGNQPYEGQVAVGAVIMNRVRSGVYPNSISEVIYQSGQFGPAMTGWLDSVLANGSYTGTAMQAAADALAGSNPIGDCLYFGNGNYGIQIGDHFFH